jgi:hypothetical protein
MNSFLTLVAVEDFDKLITAALGKYVSSGQTITGNPKPAPSPILSLPSQTQIKPFWRLAIFKLCGFVLEYIYKVKQVEIGIEYFSE